MLQIKLISISLISLLLVACGSHQQSLLRKDERSPAIKTEENNPLQILINAVNNGNLQQVKDSVANDVNINIRNNEGLTLIMIATRAQQFAVMEFLVENNVDLNLTTESDRIKPDKSALEYLEELDLADNVKKIMKGILHKQKFAVSELNHFIYSSIESKNVYLADWILKKGVNPNYVRKSGSGRDKDSPLIYLFSLKGVKDLVAVNPETGEQEVVAPNFQNLKKIFYLLVKHPDINVNLKVKKNTALKKAKRRLKKDPNYQEMVNKLISMGAN